MKRLSNIKRTVSNMPLVENLDTSPSSNVDSVPSTPSNGSSNTSEREALAASTVVAAKSSAVVKASQLASLAAKGKLSTARQRIAKKLGVKMGKMY